MSRMSSACSDDTHVCASPPPIAAAKTAGPSTAAGPAGRMCRPAAPAAALIPAGRPAPLRDARSEARAAIRAASVGRGLFAASFRLAFAAASFTAAATGPPPAGRRSSAAPPATGTPVLRTSVKVTSWGGFIIRPTATSSSPPFPRSSSVRFIFRRDVSEGMRVSGGNGGCSSPAARAPAPPCMELPSTLDSAAPAALKAPGCEREDGQRTVLCAECSGRTRSPWSPHVAACCRTCSTAWPTISVTYTRLRSV